MCEQWSQLLQTHTYDTKATTDTYRNDQRTSRSNDCIVEGIAYTLWLLALLQALLHAAHSCSTHEASHSRVKSPPRPARPMSSIYVKPIYATKRRIAYKLQDTLSFRHQASCSSAPLTFTFDQHVRSVLLAICAEAGIASNGLVWFGWAAFHF